VFTCRMDKDRPSWDETRAIGRLAEQVAASVRRTLSVCPSFYSSAAEHPNQRVQNLAGLVYAELSLCASASDATSTSRLNLALSVIQNLSDHPAVAPVFNALVQRVHSDILGPSVQSFLRGTAVPTVPGISNAATLPIPPPPPRYFLVPHYSAPAPVQTSDISREVGQLASQQQASHVAEDAGPSTVRAVAATRENTTTRVTCAWEKVAEFDRPCPRGSKEFALELPPTRCVEPSGWMAYQSGAAGQRCVTVCCRCSWKRSKDRYHGGTVFLRCRPADDGNTKHVVEQRLTNGESPFHRNAAGDTIPFTFHSED
jgi:hypothetical protein